MRFSVIIPLFNKAPYVTKALESVLVQTYRDYELIVVDDGSSDNSYELAKDLLESSGLEFQLIHQRNAGVSTARNNGISLAHGDYICFLDADDWWAPTYLERMNWFTNEFPDAGIYGTNYYYVKNGRQRICVSTVDTGYINYCKVYAEKLQMPLWTGAVCIPRSIINEFGGFKPKLKLGEDFDLWIRIALKYKVAFLNEPLSYYYQDSDMKWRLIGKLHNPQVHMLWNLGYLENEEKINPDYKKLIDGLRTYSLLPYYLSSQYREVARQELFKVDWSKQPDNIRKQYNQPIILLKYKRFLLKFGSNLKQWIIKQL